MSKILYYILIFAASILCLVIITSSTLSVFAQQSQFNSNSLNNCNEPSIQATIADQTNSIKTSCIQNENFSGCLKACAILAERNNWTIDQHIDCVIVKCEDRFAATDNFDYNNYNSCAQSIIDSTSTEVKTCGCNPKKPTQESFLQVAPGVCKELNLIVSSKSKPYDNNYGSFLDSCYNIPVLSEGEGQQISFCIRDIAWVLLTLGILSALISFGFVALNNLLNQGQVGIEISFREKIRDILVGLFFIGLPGVIVLTINPFFKAFDFKYLSELYIPSDINLDLVFKPDYCDLEPANTKPTVLAITMPKDTFSKFPYLLLDDNCMVHIAATNAQSPEGNGKYMYYRIPIFTIKPDYDIVDLEMESINSNYKQNIQRDEIGRIVYNNGADFRHAFLALSRDKKTVIFSTVSKNRKNEPTLYYQTIQNTEKPYLGNLNQIKLSDPPKTPECNIDLVPNADLSNPEINPYSWNCYMANTGLGIHRGGLVNSTENNLSLIYYDFISYQPDIMTQFNSIEGQWGYREILKDDINIGYAFVVDINAIGNSFQSNDINILEPYGKPSRASWKSSVSPNLKHGVLAFSVEPNYKDRFTSVRPTLLYRIKEGKIINNPKNPIWLNQETTEGEYNSIPARGIVGVGVNDQGVIYTLVSFVNQNRTVLFQINNDETNTIGKVKEWSLSGTEYDLAIDNKGGIHVVILTGSYGSDSLHYYYKKPSDSEFKLIYQDNYTGDSADYIFENKGSVGKGFMRGNLRIAGYYNKTNSVVITFELWERDGKKGPPKTNLMVITGAIE